MKETRGSQRSVFQHFLFDIVLKVQTNMWLSAAFFQSFKELVAACLVKDPKKRPTSEKLLKHHFFKHARSYDYLDRTILDDLAPLGERFRMLKVACLSLLYFSRLLISLQNEPNFCNTFFALFYPQAKEADLLVQNKALYEDKEQLSQVRILLSVFRTQRGGAFLFYLLRWQVWTIIGLYLTAVQRGFSLWTNTVL